MPLAIAVGERPPAWVVDQLRELDVDLDHVDDPLAVEGDPIAYVMNSWLGAHGRRSAGPVI